MTDKEHGMYLGIESTGEQVIRECDGELPNLNEVTGEDLDKSSELEMEHNSVTSEKPDNPFPSGSHGITETQNRERLSGTIETSIDSENPEPQNGERLSGRMEISIDRENLESQYGEGLSEEMNSLILLYGDHPTLDYTTVPEKELYLDSC